MFLFCFIVFIQFPPPAHLFYFSLFFLCLLSFFFLFLSLVSTTSLLTSIFFDLLFRFPSLLPISEALFSTSYFSPFFLHERNGSLSVPACLFLQSRSIYLRFPCTTMRLRYVTSQGAARSVLLPNWQIIQRKAASHKKRENNSFLKQEAISNLYDNRHVCNFS